MSEVNEMYRGIEIFEHKSQIPTAEKPLITVGYVCTVEGQTIRDHSIYLVKLKVDALLPGKRPPSSPQAPGTFQQE